MNDVLFSSKTDLWATPQAFFDKLNTEFRFTLDVAANSENAKCEKYYTKEQALLKDDRMLALEAAIRCLVDCKEYKAGGLFVIFDREELATKAIGYHECAKILCGMLEEMEAETNARHP